MKYYRYHDKEIAKLVATEQLSSKNRDQKLFGYQNFKINKLYIY